VASIGRPNDLLEGLKGWIGSERGLGEFPVSTLRKTATIACPQQRNATARNSEQPTTRKAAWAPHPPVDPDTLKWNRVREAQWFAHQDAARAKNVALGQLEDRIRALAPLVFGNPPKPLAIGVDQAVRKLLTGEASAKAIHHLLRRWTRRTAYLEALAAGGLRFDLAGQPAGEITAHQREVAAAQLAAKQHPSTARLPDTPAAPSRAGGSNHAPR
jgi:hypothetical protein